MIVFGVYAAMSAVSFGLYGVDKWKAAKRQWRVPEKTLLTVDLLGGWPGGLAGQRVFRHKTSKRSYQAAFWGIVALHVAAWGVAGFGGG
jgi:uncharacterized membrane protein YsdA (DUF1294 family)